MDQGQGDHVAIGNVGNFVAEHRHDFFFGHAAQQARGYGDQSIILESAGGKGIGLAFVNGHFGAANTGTVGQLVHGIDQPGLFGIGGGIRVNDTGVHALLGHPFAHQQGDNGAGKTDQSRENQQLSQVQTLRVQVTSHTQNIHGGAEHQHDGQVGD